MIHNRCSIKKGGGLDILLLEMKFIVRKQKFLFSKNRETTVNHHDNFNFSVEYEAAFASQVSALTIISYLSPCSPPPPILHPCQSLGTIPTAIPGLCGCMSSRHQPKPPQLTPKIMQAVRARHSGCVLACHQPDTYQQPLLLCAHSKTQ